MITGSSYGDLLHYSLSMFAEFEKLPYPSVISTSVRWNVLPHITKHGYAIMQRVIQTWIGHNATSYHNFNALPHALPYVFSQLSLVWSYLQRGTTRYCQIYKKIYIKIFSKKLTVTRCR